MKQNQIDKGLACIEGSMKLSGFHIKSAYLEMMREKLSGEISAEEFIKKIRETTKLGER
jgi:hypothetical protein